MKTCTIVNGISGSAWRIRPRLESLARASHSRLFVVDHTQPIKETIEAARRDGCQRLIVAAGDGTITKVLNALGPKFADWELAVVPAGTGNDLARSLGIPLDSVEDAWRIAIDDRAQPMDVVQVTNGHTSHFINVANGGLGGKVAMDVDIKDKRRWGAFAYWMTAVSRIVDLKPY